MTLSREQIIKQFNELVDMLAIRDTLGNENHAVMYLVMLIITKDILLENDIDELNKLIVDVKSRLDSPIYKTIIPFNEFNNESIN